MSLTIDEAIARFEQNAEQNERWASGGLNPEANAEYAEEHRQLAAWLRELQKRRESDRWIPTSEGLPEPRIDVWVNSDLGQMVGYYDETIELWYGRDCLELDVSAWRPLPEPYQAERRTDADD